MGKNLNRFIALLGVGIGSFAAAAAESAKLNALYIVSDDLNNDLGCYGLAISRSVSAALAVNVYP